MIYQRNNIDQHNCKQVDIWVSIRSFTIVGDLFKHLVQSFGQSANSRLRPYHSCVDIILNYGMLIHAGDVIKSPLHQSRAILQQFENRLAQSIH